MRTKSSVLGFLTVFLSFTYVVLATPRLGIQKDFKKDKPDIQSYSGVIRFRDFHPESNEWPPEYMGSEQLVHLAKIAYDEMVAIWRSRLLPIEQLPGAMVALATVDKILFASSIRTGINTEPPSNFHENIMKDFLETCLTEGMGTHQSGGKCGEPNVLELHYSLMGRVPIKVNEGANKKAKSAAWVRYRDQPLGTERNHKPCGQHTGAGWGCHRIFTQFDLDWVQGKTPDPTGQDQWKFWAPANPRESC